MIPKIIHYCWFGKKDLSNDMIKCIDSWKKYCDEYEIIQWDESNFNVNANEWTRQAYENKKYAFVSDYVRLEVLYKYGGLYFDTDIEVIRNLDEFLNCKVLLGFEGNDNAIATSIMGFEKNNSILNKLLKYYNNKKFVRDDGTLDCTVNVDIITKSIKEVYNIRFDNSLQIRKDGLSIYPKEIFSPKEFGTGKINKTNKTAVIHHFNASWHSNEEKKYWSIKRKLVRIFGEKLSEKLLIYYKYVNENDILTIVKRVFRILKVEKDKR